MSARAAILARLRNAQRTGRVPVVAPRPEPAFETPTVPGSETPLSRFLVELTALGVEHHVEPAPDDVCARVAALVGTRPVLCWDGERLPYGVGRVLAGAATGGSPRHAQASMEIGVTGCHAAIAETGSLVVLSGEGMPRAASLLPQVHVCVARSGEVYSTMGEFFTKRARDIAGAACCTFITGPSRTADIELTLTLGVHGPGRVVVVIGP
jgi:L-lactate dehydrogenase complex protein LldG